MELGQPNPDPVKLFIRCIKECYTNLSALKEEERVKLFGSASAILMGHLSTLCSFWENEDTAPLNVLANYALLEGSDFSDLTLPSLPWENEFFFMKLEGFSTIIEQIITNYDELFKESYGDFVYHLIDSAFINQIRNVKGASLLSLENIRIDIRHENWLELFNHLMISIHSIPERLSLSTGRVEILTSRILLTQRILSDHGTWRIFETYLHRIQNQEMLNFLSLISDNQIGSNSASLAVRFWMWTKELDKFLLQIERRSKELFAESELCEHKILDLKEKESKCILSPNAPIDFFYPWKCPASSTYNHIRSSVALGNLQCVNFEELRILRAKIAGGSEVLLRNLHAYLIRLIEMRKLNPINLKDISFFKHISMEQ